MYTELFNVMAPVAVHKVGYGKIQLTQAMCVKLTRSLAPVVGGCFQSSCIRLTKAQCFL